VSWNLSVRRGMVLLAAAAVLAACGGGAGSSSPAAQHGGSAAGSQTAGAGQQQQLRVTWPFRHPLPGMPPVIGNDVYSQTRAGMLSPKVKHDPSLLYVPDSSPYGHTVTVINPRTHRIIRRIPVGYMSQHVVPSYDLSTLLTNSSLSNELVKIDPRTGRRTQSIPVPRPYNLYYTPDGKTAVVMVEQDNVIRFSDPTTFRPLKDVSAPGCLGPNHADFSGNGRFFVVTCEFSGVLVKVSTLGRKVLGVLKLDPRPTAPNASTSGLMGMSMPQDIRLSPDGKIFYVADMGTNELRLISAKTFKQVGVIGMPSHPHGLYPSRDGKEMYISDRGAGEVSVLDFKTNHIVATWTIPGGGSPDMGGVSADGKTLWLSGRYDGVVYGFDTHTGKLIAKIPVGGSPHGTCVWPQPGRYSLGHTGNMR
jgi:DNA-binding beta-propeller fold protein YncE